MEAWLTTHAVFCLPHVTSLWVSELGRIPPCAGYAARASDSWLP